VQKILFPMKYLRITTGYGVGSHQGSYAIDNAGKDTGADAVYAPFDGVVKKVWPSGNTVWLESSAKVLFANGAQDYATASFTHDNDVSDLKVGQKMKQGQLFYREGDKGIGDGKHLHLEIGRGKFTGTGWHKTGYTYEGTETWTINNGVKPESAFFLKEDTITINGNKYKWKTEDTMTDQDKKDLALGRLARKYKWREQVDAAKKLAEAIAKLNQSEAWLTKLVKIAQGKR
jgi:murein DD-endopeptidase MepM/ murein hydrolase activator NlpD